MKYTAIRKYIEKTTGLDISSIGEDYFVRQVESHMKRSGISNPEEYLSLIESSETQRAYLTENIVVHETWFFREAGAFHYLEKFIDDIRFTGKFPGRLKILSVPCSSGEEPYSIAMTLIDAGLDSEKFHIDAVDISGNDIEKARRGLYGKTSFRGKKSERFMRYFKETKDGFLIDKRVIGTVRFHEENCILPDFTGNRGVYHIIFCRNLLIYLTQEARQSVLSNLDRLLTGDSLLFTGHSETQVFNRYGYISVNYPGAFAFRKPGKSELPDPAIAIKKPGKQLRKRPDKTVDKLPSAASRFQLETASIRKHSLTGKETSLLEEVRVLANKGNLEEADTLCTRFLETNDPNAELYYLMGLIHHANDRLDMAEDYFLKSVYLDPRHYESLMHLSLLYEHRGDDSRKNLYRKRAERSHAQTKK